MGDSGCQNIDIWWQIVCYSDILQFVYSAVKVVDLGGRTRGVGNGLSSQAGLAREGNLDMLMSWSIVYAILWLYCHIAVSYVAF